MALRWLPAGLRWRALRCQPAPRWQAHGASELGSLAPGPRPTPLERRCHPDGCGLPPLHWPQSAPAHHPGLGADQLGRAVQYTEPMLLRIPMR